MICLELEVTLPLKDYRCLICFVRSGRGLFGGGLTCVGGCGVGGWKRGTLIVFPPESALASWIRRLHQADQRLRQADKIKVYAHDQCHVAVGVLRLSPDLN